ncbi:MAG: HEAT repeat domain-containing protein [Planctomycetota bacterium]
MTLRILLYALAALSCLLGPARGQADVEAQRLDAVKEFKRFYRKFKEVPQKVEAIYTLKGNECVPACDELLKLLTDAQEDIRRAALDVVTTYGADATWEHVLGSLKDRRGADRAAVIDAVGRAGIKSAVPVLVELGADKDAETRYAVLRALGRLGDPSVSDLVVALLGDPDLRVRVAAADAVTDLRLKAAGTALLPLLDDSAWQVQAAAIKALGIVRPAEAIMPLIGLMRKGGRLREDAADALFSITTMDFGTDPDEWQKQMERLFRLEWRPPTDAEVEKARLARKKSAAFYGAKDDVKTFANIPIVSDYVLFIVDVSGSMSDLVVERDKFQGYEDYQKLTIVKSELSKTVDSLGPNTYFNIVAFASDLKPWKSYLVPANITNKESARAWIKNLRSIGGAADQELANVGLSSNIAEGKTNTFKALMFPFGIDPEQPRRAATTAPSAVAKVKLDTVYFLSDGRPSVGKVVDTEEIRKAVKEENQVYKIVLHTIAIGEFQKEFLNALAVDNGGVFVDLGR